jgi:putative ABC transport system permease protein
MNFVALKMLVGDAGKYLGMIFGVTFAAFLMTQQGAIFLGLMTRTFGFISDTRQPDVWVMDPKVQFVDDIKPVQDTVLLRVRGTEGVQWAVPLYKGLLKARLANGAFQTCNVIGIDDATLIGGPPKMIEGRLEDLRQADGVIVDDIGAAGKLARPSPDGKGTVPLKIGDTLELNDRRAVVVGICKVSRTFQSQPVVYTTYTRATQFAPRERKLMSFILAKANDGLTPGQLAARINATFRDAEGKPTLAAYTGPEFVKLTYGYFIKNTGIPINFGISVTLGFIVGAAICGQTFYQFTLDNLRHLGALKAMGTGNFTLLRMILLQAVVVGVIGYGMGIGLASLLGIGSGDTELAFFLPWQLLIFTGVAVTVIILVSAVLSLLKVMRLEPAVVFKG